MTSSGHSYLDGKEWVLRTRVVQGVLTHDASIQATHETRDRWNQQFWRLFAADPSALAAQVAAGNVSVSLMFRFQPTARVKQRYGGLPVLKVARAAEGFRGPLDRLPDGMGTAIEEYERDMRSLEQQRHRAWLELLHSRLPEPPSGYRWELVSGEARSYSDMLQFELRAR